MMFGCTFEEHDHNLHELMQTAKYNGLIFNSEKYQINLQAISFKNGMKPNLEKVYDIQDLLAPESIKQLQSFLRLMNYMQPFMPCMFITVPLPKQLKHWNWNISTNAVFQHLKASLAHHFKKSLICYNRSKDMTIQTNTTKHGLGAALM